MEKRNLSPEDYLNVLQLEYLIAEFRRAIYYNPKTKRYLQKVMDIKKEKTIALSKQLNLPSMFTDKNILITKKKDFYSAPSMPIFEGLNEQDVRMYFLTGQRVIVSKKEEDSITISYNATIKGFDQKRSLVNVEPYGTLEELTNRQTAENEWVRIGEVKRVLFPEKKFFI